MTGFDSVVFLSFLDLQAKEISVRNRKFIPSVCNLDRRLLAAAGIPVPIVVQVTIATTDTLPTVPPTIADPAAFPPQTQDPQQDLPLPSNILPPSQTFIDPGPIESQPLPASIDPNTVPNDTP